MPEPRRRMPRPNVEEPVWGPVSDEVLNAWGGRFHHHMLMATEGAREWEERNDYLNDYCEANRIIGQGKVDKKAKDQELIDAMAKWSWHEREAKRFCDAILAETALRRALL